MARGYGFEKRRRELAKKKKREEKRERLRARRAAEGEGDATPRAESSEGDDGAGGKTVDENAPADPA